MADNPNQIYGTYAPDVDPNYTQSPYNGLKLLANQANLAWGCSDNHCNDYDANAVKDALNNTELIFVCLGTGK